MPGFNCSTFQSNGITPHPKVPPLALDISPDDGTEGYRPLSQVSASTTSLGLGASFSNFEKRMPPRYSTPREKVSLLLHYFFLFHFKHLGRIPVYSYEN
jgi:hypothetical protein